MFKTSHSAGSGPLAALLLTLPLALAACGGGNDRTSSLVIQESANIPTLDPGVSYDTASGQFIENIYEPLLSYDGSSLTKLAPVLATGWTVSPDNRTYTFTLRQNVKFQSGNAMTCADPEYSLRRNLVTNSSESGNWFLSQSLLGTQKNAASDPGITWARISAAVRCNDAGQLVLTLPTADPALLAKLAFTGQSVVDSKHAKEIGEWDGTEATWKTWVGKDLTNSALSNSPSGTGAYQLVKRDANSAALKAFDGYWGGAPKIKTVLYTVVPELASRQQAFLKGDADLIEAGTRANIQEQLAGKDGVTVLDGLPNVSAFAIFMNENIQNPAALGSGKLDGQGIPATFFSDAGVRRGFNLAFDPAVYISAVQQGKGKPRTMLLPDTFPGYDAAIPTYSHNAEEAAAAFRQAFGGQVWQRGFTVNASYRAGSASSQTAMELLKKNIEALNPKFHINLTAKPWATLIQDAQAGREPMVLNGWAPDYADADNFMYTFYSSRGYYHSASNFTDPQVDAWLEQARRESDPARRNTLYGQVGQRAFQQGYYIVLPAADGITVYRNTIQGVSLGTYNPMRAFNATGTLWKDLSKS